MTSQYHRRIGKWRVTRNAPLGTRAFAAEAKVVEALLPQFSEAGDHRERVISSPWDGLTAHAESSLFVAALHRVPKAHAAILTAASCGKLIAFADQHALSLSFAKWSLHRARMAVITIAATIRSSSNASCPASSNSPTRSTFRDH